MVKVLLVDDHELIAIGLNFVFNETADIRMVGVAESGEQAISWVEEKRPDVIFMDIDLPGISGAEASKRIISAYPDIKIIVLSQHNENSLTKCLLNIGAVGYLSKTATNDEIILAIRKVMAGEFYLCTDVANKLILKTQDKDHNNPFSKLSRREREVMELILQGKSIQEMAVLLGVKDKTINTFRHRLYKKLGVKNDVELIRLIERFNGDV